MTKLIKLIKKNKKKTFLIVVLDYRFKTNRVLEKLGSYNPLNKEVNLNLFRLSY